MNFKSSFNNPIKGIPKIIYSGLPREFKDSIQNGEIKIFTPTLLVKELQSFYTGSVKNKAERIFEIWKEQFLLSFEDSTHKNKFIEIELEKHDFEMPYKSVDNSLIKFIDGKIDMLPDYLNEGYMMAIKGENTLYGVHISDESFKYIENDDWDFSPIGGINFYNHGRLLIEGFAHALMNKFIRENYSPLYNTIENKNSKENAKVEINNTVNNKLNWKGKPAHLAFIIDLLIEKGYLEATPYGERTAELLLMFFDFGKHKPSKESLGKLLHKDNYPIKDQTVIDKFKKIPKRDELK